MAQTKLTISVHPLPVAPQPSCSEQLFRRGTLGQDLHLLVHLNSLAQMQAASRVWEEVEAALPWVACLSLLCYRRHRTKSIAGLGELLGRLTPPHFR